jgi:hypothetical protein
MFPKNEELLSSPFFLLFIIITVYKEPYLIIKLLALHSLM